MMTSNAALAAASSNNKFVVTHLIHQTVLEFVTSNEVSSPSSLAHKSLHKYLSNPTTVDIVYAKLMERVRSDKTNNRAIIASCIQVLKTHLFAYVPKTETLIQLERFCLGLQPDNEPLAKSIKYVRAIIANRLLQNTKDEALILAELPPGDRSSHSIPLLSSVSILGVEKENTHTPSALIPLTASLTPDPLTQNTRNSHDFQIAGAMANNFLSQRTFLYSSKLHPLPAAPVSLAIFCEMFRYVGPATVTDMKEYLHIHDASQTRDRISAVSLAKKKEETMSYREAGQLTVRRKGVHLFHYKYYKEQLPLELSREEMDEVYEVITNPEADHESCLIGSKIMIKLVIDAFCKGDYAEARRLLVDLTRRMFKTNHTERKLHAFNLIFNISIHAGLIDEISVTDLDEKKAISPLALNVLEQLFDVLKETLRLMVKENEKDTKVWSAALNCLLFFIAKRGKVDVKKLLSLDVVVIPAFIRNLWDVFSHDSVMRELISMLMHLIYQQQQPPKTHSISSISGISTVNNRASVSLTGSSIPNPSFDVDTFNRCCNIDFIISIYRRTPSAQALENLFVVIYDYTIHRYVNKKLDATATEQAELLLAVLKRAGAPIFLTDIFKFTPKNMVESLARVLCLDYYAKEIKLDKDFALSVLRGLKKLARSYLQVDSEYKAQIQTTLNASKHSSQTASVAMETLSKLLRDEKLRHHGQEWLFSLVLANFDEPRSLTPQIVMSLEKVINEVTSSPDPLVRRVYITVTEQLILYLRSKAHQASEDENMITTITNVINGQFVRVIRTGEKNENNLMLVFDTIVNFILIYSPGAQTRSSGSVVGTGGGSGSSSDILDQEAYGDTPSALFANGRAMVSQTLLHMINIELFCYLFTNLPPRQQARVTLLLLIIEHCKNKSTLQKVGGLAFFRSLLTDYPDIVYYSSRFLIEQFQSEKPEQFQALLTQLVNKAQQTNNEQLLDNSYLQIRALTGSLL